MSQSPSGPNPPRPQEPSEPPIDVTPAAPPSAGLSPQTVVVDEVPPPGELPPPHEAQPSAQTNVAPDGSGYGTPDWRPEYRPAPAPKAWTRWVPQTLAGRLAAGTVVLVVVLVGLISTATYYSLHSFLLDKLDQQVSDLADRNASDLGHCFGAGSTSCYIGGRPGPNGYQVRGPQKQWVALLTSSESAQLTSNDPTDLVPMKLTSDQVRDLFDLGNRGSTITTTDGSRIRVATSPIGGGSNAVVAVGLSTADIDDTLHRLFLLEVAIGGAAILIALLVTSTGLRVGLGPLRRVTRTAQEVTSELSPSGGGLDRRVPATGSTTEVGQLADSFNTMLDRVETEFAARRESEERMRQFLADASHELRTPLTSIRGYAELARLERARAGTTSDSDDTLGRIETEGTRMSRLVEDLLLLARGDDAAQDSSVTTERFPVDVADLVDDVTGGVRAAFPQRRLEVDVSTQEMTVLADRDQLVRVLRNLVVNACVHTDPAGTITVAAAPVVEGIELSVSDEGPGLAPDEAAHVFERFWRADKARTRARGGSGLGMAIVAQIVTAHGGQVRFDSAVATGSHVSVILPTG